MWIRFFLVCIIIILKALWTLRHKIKPRRFSNYEACLLPWSPGQWHSMTFDPSSVEVTCVTLPKYHCILVPCKCRSGDQKLLFKGSIIKQPLGLWWALTYIPWGHMHMSNSHGYSSKHQSVWKQRPNTLTSMTHTTFKRPLAPHIYWGHICDSTQGLFCTTPVKIHQKPFSKTSSNGQWHLGDLWPPII